MSLLIVAHHLLFCCALLFTERRQGMTQHVQRFFRSTLQLFGQLKQLGYADTLNDADIDLPRQHLGAFILQKLLELVHEHDKIQGVQPGFDEVVGFPARQVVPGFQFVERRLDSRTGRARLRRPSPAKTRRER